MFFRKPTSALALGTVLAASVVVLGTALLSQYVGGLQPCILCLYQRVPYGVVIVLTALVLAWEFYGNSLAPGVARGYAARRGGGARKALLVEEAARGFAAELDAENAVPARREP